MTGKEHGVFSNILIAYDDSPGARTALQIGVELATQAGGRATLTVVAVEAALPHYGATVGEFEAEQEFEERRCERWLDAARAYAADRDVDIATEIRAGHPAQELLRTAQFLESDVIVLGHSGHSAVWGRFLGSTTEKVSRHAHCSVLIAAPPEGRPGS